MGFTPALFTRISMFSGAVDSHSRTELGHERSSSERAGVRTVIPVDVKTSAIDLPMPRDAPVTKATLDRFPAKGGETEVIGLIEERACFHAILHEEGTEPCPLGEK
jgi:hypothetical protein